MGIAIRQAQDSRNGMSLTNPPLSFSPTITIQIFNGRKTDQCGVILFGSEGSQP
jgi:hypothetical protein